VSYELRIKPSAVKELKGLAKKDRLRMADRIEALSGDPRPRGCEKLTGGVRYRVRQGSHRVLYEVDDRDRVVTVVKIGHRSDVYRQQ
jgi:mRNA interferase RelE/StbE